MAVMTTQQSEGALLSAKPLQATVSLEKDKKDGPNGHVEVNGYVAGPFLFPLKSHRIASHRIAC